MRWEYTPAPPEPRDGDRRTRSGFLFRVRYIDGEARWLERASWIEQCEDKLHGWEAPKWRPIRWVDEDPA